MSDTDPGINSFISQNWTSVVGESLGVVEEWRPWTLDSCIAVGGYVTQFGAVLFSCLARVEANLLSFGRYKGNFQFLTIRGSGHMVPTSGACSVPPSPLTGTTAGA